MSETTTTSIDLEVPGEPGVFWCAKHKNVKTRLRCGRCEKPICPKCTKIGPTGARCSDCFYNKGSHIYQLSPGLLALAFVSSLVLGALGVVLVQFVGLLLVFFAPVIGTFFGKAVTKVTRGKRGTRLAIVASAGTAVGALVPLAINLMQARSMAGPGVLLDAAVVLIYLALVIPSLWWWIK